MPRSFNAQLRTPFHAHVIAILKAMGYPYDEAGVCFGIAATLSVANLAGKLQIFEESLNALSHADPHTINSPNHGLSPEEYRDLLALLESIAMHQDIRKIKHVFPLIMPYLDQNAGVLEAGKILTLRDQGTNNVTQVHMSGIAVNMTELGESMLELSEGCKILSESGYPIAILISKLGHTISCNFNPITSEWFCIDANSQILGSSPLFTTDSIPRLISFIWTNLNEYLDNTSECVIDFQTLCRNNDLAQVKAALSDWTRHNDTYLSEQHLSSLGPETLAKFIKLSIRANKLDAIEAIFNADLDHEAFYQYPGAIRYAILYGRNDILLRLLDEGIDPNRPIPGTESFWQTAMSVDNTDAIQILLEDIVTDKDFIHENLTPLLLNYVCEHGRVDLAQYLLRYRGISINDQERNGDTALHCAVRSGNIDLVKFLINHPSINPNIGDYHYNTAYHLAMMLSDSAENAQSVRRFRAIAQVIANHPKFDPTKHTAGDPNLLFYYVKQGNIAKLDRILWTRQDSKPQLDDEGLSILHHALNQSPQLLLRLIKHYTNNKELHVYELTQNLKALQENEWRNYASPLMFSLYLLSNMPYLIEAYLNQGDETLSRPLYSALVPYATTLQTLIDIYMSRPPIPDDPQSGLSLLEVSILMMNEPLLEILLKNNDIVMKLNTTNRSLGSTPLSMGFNVNNYSILLKLIQAGSNLDELYRMNQPQLSEDDRKELKKITSALRDHNKLIGDSPENQTYCAQALILDNKYGTHLEAFINYEMERRVKELALKTPPAGPGNKNN